MPHPVLSRRREIGHASARSLLMTVLGEFVLSREKPVWTATFVTVLGLLGIEEKAARQALSRTAAEGWLSSQRHGRRVRWELTGTGRRLLSEGAQRIYGFGREDHEWDGDWVVLLLSVPESERDLRRTLRTRLSWAGFGSPAPGVWISPDRRRETEAARIIAELAPRSAAMSFQSRYGSIGEEADLVARSWNLSEVERCYAEFIAEFTDLDESATDPFCAQTRLVHEWRRFPFLDPRLPVRLLPPNWNGLQAARLFHDKHHDWRAPSQRRWDELAAT